MKQENFINQKRNKSAFAILEVVVALALTLLVASVVFFYGRIIIENSKISKLKSDIDLTVSSVKNGFYSLYEKYPGMLSEEEIRSSFSDDKGTLSCSGAGTSDLSCYLQNPTKAVGVALPNSQTNGYNFDSNNIDSGAFLSNPYNPKIKNAINQLILSGNAPRGLVDLNRSVECDNIFCASDIWTSSFQDKYQIPFNSSFKGYYHPFTSASGGYFLSFTYPNTSYTGSNPEAENTARLGLKKNYYLSINGKDLFTSKTSYIYPNAWMIQNPIITKQQAYKFSQKFNNGAVIGYADSDYHLVKSSYRYDITADPNGINYLQVCNDDTTSMNTKKISEIKILNPSNADSMLYPRDIKYGCMLIVKAGDGITSE